MSWLDFLTKLVPFIKVLIGQIELPQTSFKKNLTLNLMFACVAIMFLLTVLMIEQAIIQADSKYDNMKQNESTRLALDICHASLAGQPTTAKVTTGVTK